MHFRNNELSAKAHVSVNLSPQSLCKITFFQKIMNIIIMDTLIILCQYSSVQSNPVLRSITCFDLFLNILSYILFC